MKVQRTSRRVLLAAALALTGLVGTDAHAAPPTWAPAATAQIFPGVMTNNASGQCTANFVFYDANNDIYIGHAAHCTTLGGATDTNGCLTNSRPIGTPVTVGSYSGTLAYNSWITMRSVPEPTNSNQCRYNDFGLIKLNPADYNKVNPSVPFWGGPVGINTSGTVSRDRVFSYGNSSLRLGFGPLRPKTGVSTGTSGGGWTHSIYTATPGIPGDSGSAVLDKTGNALGTLSTLSVNGSNGAGDINNELNYLRAHTSFPLNTLVLATGTQPFAPIV